MITLAQSDAVHHQNDITPVPEPPPQEHGWRSHDAPCIHTLKWTDPELFVEHVAVLRADSLDEMWIQVRTVMALIKASRAKQTGPTNGATTGQSDPSYCALHKTAMLQKNGKFFHATNNKTAEGKTIWCKGVA